MASALHEAHTDVLTAAAIIPLTLASWYTHPPTSCEANIFSMGFAPGLDSRENKIIRPAEGSRSETWNSTVPIHIEDGLGCSSVPGNANVTVTSSPGSQVKEDSAASGA